MTYTTNTEVVEELRGNDVFDASISTWGTRDDTLRVSTKGLGGYETDMLRSHGYAVSFASNEGLVYMGDT